MPNQGKHGKARAAAETREDIISSTAMSAMSAGTVSAMGTVGAARHQAAQGDAGQKAGMVLAPVREMRGQGRTCRRSGGARASLEWRRHVHRGLRQDLAGTGEEGAQRAPI